MVTKDFVRADLHTHSKFSEHPSEWILQKLGTSESYTEPEEIYRKATANGMNFVTITDHNQIEGAVYLTKQYPENTFMGVEATAYFPEDGCKIHILIYDFTKEQFTKIDELRRDIYKLRDFIKENHLPHSVAHATFSVNSRLTFSHLERLILLFDIFETVNGGRNLYSNELWQKVLANLTPDTIKKLQSKYDIVPFSDTPWIKGFTGGSDDHAGLLIGKTFTTAECRTKEEFLQALRNKKTLSGGRHNEFYSLAFAIYKIAWDFMRFKNPEGEKGFFSLLNEMIFNNGKELSFKKKLIVKHLKSKYKKRNDVTKSLLMDFIEKIQKSEIEIEDKIEELYTLLTKLTDQYFATLINSLLKESNKLDLINIFQKISSSFIGIFITLPFITTLKHMYENRPLLDTLSREFLPHKPSSSNKVVWFTDTISDLNGVSVTLKKIGALAFEKNINLTIAGSLLDDEMSGDLPPNFKNLEPIYHFTPKEYENYTFKIPSVMKTIKEIYELHPDTIIISTPGPVGLAALLCARLLNIKTKSVYHTDFTLEFEKIIGESSPSHLVDGYLKWFYNQTDQILVPTTEYISILEERGYEKNKMSVFRRGLDLTQFAPRDKAAKFIKDFYNLPDGFNLLYTGRISKDKNIDFLFDVLEKLEKTRFNYNLILTGDGPYLSEAKKKTKHNNRIVYTGKLRQNFLPYLYSGADLFLFPSTTDTFGMSVLEAQACGLPAIVSSKGGPKEIIVDGVTGYSLPVEEPDEWCRKIAELTMVHQEEPETFNRIKSEATGNVERNYDWDKILETLFN